MSVTITRNTGAFNLMVNLSVKLKDVTLKKLAPGESTNFELPNATEKIKVSCFFAHKEIEVRDGQIVTIQKNIPVKLFQFSIRFLLFVLLLLITFRIITSLALVIVLSIALMILYTYAYFFIPDFKLEIISNSSTN